MLLTLLGLYIVCQMVVAVAIIFAYYKLNRCNECQNCDPEERESPNVHDTIVAEVKKEMRKAMAEFQEMQGMFGLGLCYDQKIMFRGRETSLRKAFDELLEENRSLRLSRLEFKDKR